MSAFKSEPVWPTDALIESTSAVVTWPIDVGTPKVRLPLIELPVVVAPSVGLTASP